ncbi:extracellular solute-binding protein [Actinoalloteichus hymeniacidonis]|uniref:Cellobiose-binding protein n=1 Tax=Actinoalloteichus hymeniacidonis TaxID=340345 RepID=A0AAC9HN41_9PSEU|nr:extracellular solute-binding protein [Actinoalloteichus hymeniacidonis]AOS62227.1 cellobiose-binding protein [Actinoalloteichus hymeniacidonis]MBB5909747.1 cellobiose transport system substrate-binding protein [Actinoalloteichus hymeniacidonis]
MRGIRPGRVAVTALGAAAATLLAGCGGGQAAGDENTIVVATFGDFGYDVLQDDFAEEFPGITLETRLSEFDAHHQQLQTQLAGGRGAADIVAIEEGWIPQYRESNELFLDLSTMGAADIKDRWAEWKWEQGVAGDGDFVLGLGTDAGPLAMCYRTDLFEAAGLPTDRDEVSALWPTWDEYAQVADDFTAETPEVAFADSAENIYGAIINQSPEGYFAAADDSYIADENPVISDAFELAGGMAEDGQTAQIKPFTQEWNVALAQGGFATMTCPAWMLAQMESAAGEANAGVWDVASVPGGGGNWGGSILTIPAQGENTELAYRVAEWLTAPEQQKTLFMEKGILPSQPEVYHDPDVLGSVNEYFNDAPVGEIFAASADSLQPNYRGTQDFVVRSRFQEALGRVEEGAQDADAAFAEALEQSERELG